MKLALSATFASLIALYSQSAHAADVKSFDGSPYIKGGVNTHFFDSDKNVDNDSTLYIGGGYFFDPHWGVDFEYYSGNTDFDNVNGDIDYSLLSIMAVYRIKPLQDNSWFIRGGLGSYDFGKDDTAVRIGGGYERFIQPNLSYTINADVVIESEADLSAGLGLVYYFGNANKAPKPILKPEPRGPIDSDNDGVYNNNDRCPATFKGAKVDSKGCELDTDRDSVVNRLDQCPATPQGHKVDSQGCSIDSDMDGVLNKADQCPNTPSGAKVDESGCEAKLAKEVTFDLNVQFANNSMQIESAYVDKIQALAAFMKQYPSAKVVIEGHTDSRGSASYNQRLSQQRAEAVKSYLIEEFNIDGRRLSALGRGEESPIADNNSAEGRQLNRRVVAVVKATSYQ